ncbi:outer membrane beta-barrel family protein [Spirosoma flavus]
MRPVFVIFLFLILPFSAFNQTLTNRLNGSVNDIQNVALPGATVRLLRLVDSTLVAGIQTEVNGKFAFTNLPMDTYRIHITSVGNNDYWSTPITVDEQHPAIELPVFIVTPSKTMLNEVKVVAKKPLLEQDIDKTIVNVEAMIGSASSNTLEVLEKTPGVSVDLNGEISLNGKAGVVVLIDGRPTYMSGQDLAAYLKSLPGGSLDKLELMTNPPAKYDAAGTSIINIRLKRAKIQGFTGGITAGYNQGITGRNNNALNLNYNRGKVNLFGSLSYNKDGNFSNDIYDRKFYDANNRLTSTVKLDNRYTTTSHSIGAKLGMDYAASPNTVYGFVLNFQRSPRRERLDYVSQSFANRYVPDSVGRGSTDGRFLWTNSSVNGNFQHKFGKSGREISADLNYIQYVTEGEQFLQNQVNTPSDSLLNSYRFLYKLPSTIQIYSAKADYSHPFSKKAKLETGVKTSYVSNDNNAQYFNQANERYVPDYRRSNHFLYHETIYAAYINGRNEWKRIAAQTGLRLENTQIVGQQLGNSEVAGTSFTRNYTSLFPTVFVSYKLDSTGQKTLTISLSRRISRPNYQLLNPFLAFRDQYSFTAGNPYLKPQYHTQYEVKYQHKQILGLALQYSRFSDVIFQLTETVGDTFVIRPSNIANGYILALNTNVSLSPTKWWNLNANVTLAHLELRGMAFSQSLNPSIYHARLNLMNQLRFNQGWGAEMIGYFTSGDLAGQTVTRPRYRVAAAVQKKIFQDKGSIRLTFDDIFHSWRTIDRTVSLRQADALHTNVSDTQRIGLSFTYRFGKETFVRKRNHSDNASDEERNRVN